MAARTNDDGFVRMDRLKACAGATLKGEERKAVTLGEFQERVPNTVAVFLVGVVSEDVAHDDFDRAVAYRLKIRLTPCWVPILNVEDARFLIS